jgi:MarR family transcriptional regulator, organic hydroperoxide resistance regulator
VIGASDNPRLDELLCFLVYSTGLSFNRVYRKPLEALGLTYPQYIVMVVLWAEDGLSIGEIGQRIGLDSGTLTPLLKRLEAMGVLTRERSAKDERRVEIRLTPTGSSLRRKAGDVMRCIDDAIAMPSDKVSHLVSSLGALRANLERMEQKSSGSKQVTRSKRR